MVARCVSLSILSSARDDSCTLVPLNFSRFLYQSFGQLANEISSTQFNLNWTKAAPATERDLNVLIGSQLCAAPLETLDLSSVAVLLVEADCSIGASLRTSPSRSAGLNQTPISLFAAVQANHIVNGGGTVALIALDLSATTGESNAQAPCRSLLTYLPYFDKDFDAFQGLSVGTVDNAISDDIARRVVSEESLRVMYVLLSTSVCSFRS